VQRHDERSQSLTRRKVGSSLPEPTQQLLASVASYEQGDEGSNRGAIKLGRDPFEALIDVLRIDLFVELLVHEVRDVMKVLVDAWWWCRAGPDR
jgi:hypothetical protein